MCLQDWQWQLGAIAIFLAWIDLVLFIRKVPRFGIYVVMFTDVLITFIQFFPVFFLFIIAFALAFYALLQNQVSRLFYTLLSSLPFNVQIFTPCNSLIQYINVH